MGTVLRALLIIAAIYTASPIRQETPPLTLAHLKTSPSVLLKHATMDDLLKLQPETLREGVKIWSSLDAATQKKLLLALERQKMQAPPALSVQAFP
jgi:hypothetical protein